MIGKAFASDRLRSAGNGGSLLMPWARIDDAFDDHPKVLAVLEHETGLAAIGLWTLCLTYAHRNTLKRGKTPGLIPSHLPRRYFGPGGRELAAILVKEGLWEALAEGEGWMIHDFDQYLPSEKTSNARSEAGKKGAESRWGKRAADGKEPETDGKLPSGGSKGPSAGHNPASKPMASDGSRAPARRAISNEIATRDPSPDPVQQPPTSVAAANESRRGAVSTPTQRAKPITDAYYAIQPMCKWTAINGIVVHAIKTGKYADEEVHSALLRLAEGSRTVTIESLRVEIEGFAPRSQPVVDRRQAATDQKFDRAMARARAKDAQETQR